MRCIEAVLQLFILILSGNGSKIVAIYGAIFWSMLYLTEFAFHH
jgi:hypothetical protein